MGGRFDDAGADALTKLVRQQVADLHIGKEIKDLLLYIVDNSSAFIAFTRAYVQQRAKGSVRPTELMTDFLTSKGRSMADFGVSTIDSETLSDLWAVVSLIMNVRDSVKYASSGPVGLALTVGFLLNDAADFLANFTPAQRAYYEMFLKKSSVMVWAPGVSGGANGSPARGVVVRCY